MTVKLKKKYKQSYYQKQNFIKEKLGIHFFKILNLEIENIFYAALWNKCGRSQEEKSGHEFTMTSIPGVLIVTI